MNSEWLGHCVDLVTEVMGKYTWNIILQLLAALERDKVGPSGPWSFCWAACLRGGSLSSPLGWGYLQRSWARNKLSRSPLSSFLALFQVHSRVYGRVRVANLVLLGQSPSDCPECVWSRAIAGCRSVHLMSTNQGLSNNLPAPTLPPPPQPGSVPTPH